MYMRTRYFIAGILLLALFAGCSSDSGEGDAPGGGSGDLYGYVRDASGSAIEGVVVSDGFNVTKTDAEGRYWLKTKLSRSEFVMITTPRGYDPEVYSGFLPKFFYALDKTAG